MTFLTVILRLRELSREAATRRRSQLQEVMNLEVGVPKTFSTFDISEFFDEEIFHLERCTIRRRDSRPTMLGDRWRFSGFEGSRLCTLDPIWRPVNDAIE